MQHQVVFHYIMRIKSYNFGTEKKKKSLISQSEVEDMSSHIMLSMECSPAEKGQQNL